MHIHLGTAPDSWGVWFAADPRQTPWQRFLDEVASLGYEWIELGPLGYMPTDLAVLRPELAKRGLKIVANAIDGHLPADPNAWPALERELREAGEILAALGAPYIILIDSPYADSPDLDERGWHNLIDATHRAANLVRERFGLQLLFHPHAETHVETEAQIEKFLRGTDPARVNLCFDIGHHAYSGGDPIAFMRKHHARIPYLHLKSVDADVQRKITAQTSFAEAVSMNVFCEPSQGAVDFIAFRDVLRAIDYNGFAIVEQDMYPALFDKPLPVAKRTRDYLLSIGIGA